VEDLSLNDLPAALALVLFREHWRGPGLVEFLHENPGFTALVVDVMFSAPGPPQFYARILASRELAHEIVELAEDNPQLKVNVFPYSHLILDGTTLH